MLRASAMGVRYQLEEEAVIFATLANPECVQLRLPPVQYDGVVGRLKWISRNYQNSDEEHKSRLTFSALIDVGAIITGLNNKEVAAALLVLGLDDFDGVVYLDNTGN